MGSCSLDHSLEDVQKKFETQKAYLPSNIRDNFLDRLGASPSQETLNEVFHLLKRYDLATEEERESRNGELGRILSKKEQSNR